MGACIGLCVGMGMQGWLGDWRGRPGPLFILRVILLPCLPLSASPTHPPPTLPASPPRRPYLVGTGGGGLELVELDGPIAKVQITGPAANVMTVRVAVTQKLRERIPAIAAVQLVN